MENQLYSIWDWHDGRYFYFTGPRPHAEATLPMRPPLGDPPDRLAPELPPGAKYIGKGDLPYGIIARPNRGHLLEWTVG